MDRRGVVLQVRDREATVLVEGGEIRRVTLGLGDVAPGQEIWVPDDGGMTWRAAALAAALALVLLGGGLLTWSRTVPTLAAVVSVDVNPSVDFGVSSVGQVIWAHPLDQAGRRVVAAIPWRGARLDQAVEDFTDEAARQGYLRAGGVIVVAGGPVGSQASRGAVPRVLARVAATLTRAASKLPALRRAEVVVLPAASPPEVKAALRDRVSIGRYVLARLTHRTPTAPLDAMVRAWRGTKTRPHQRATAPGPEPSVGKSRSGSGPVESVRGLFRGVSAHSIEVGARPYPLGTTVAVHAGAISVPLSAMWNRFAGRAHVTVRLVEGHVVAIDLPSWFPGALARAVRGFPHGGTVSGAGGPPRVKETPPAVKGHPGRKKATAKSGPTSSKPKTGLGRTAPGVQPGKSPHAAPTSTVTGVFGGITADTVTIAGKAYPLAAAARLEAGAEPLTPRAALDALAGRVHVVATVTGGVVEALRFPGWVAGVLTHHAGHGGQAPSGGTAKEPGHGSEGGHGPGAVTTRVVGTLTAVGVDTLAVDGQVYQVAPTAVVLEQGIAVPWSAAVLTLDVGRPVELWIQQATVMRVRVTGPPPGQLGPRGGNGSAGRAHGHGLG